MSGNTTQTGYKTGQIKLAEAILRHWHCILFGRSFAGALLAHSAVRRTRRLVLVWSQPRWRLIFSFTQLGFCPGSSISVLSFAMGLAIPAVRSQQIVSLTFVGHIEQAWGASCDAVKHLL